MPITINSNLFSLTAQRGLTRSSENLETSLERLSSGLRINSAVDDAAGLAIATSLSSNARVYTQAIRNINDGISAISIASNTLTELSGITQRLSELAEQASNGTYSKTQRSAINSEATALVQEYNRITQSTDFNGLNLLDGSLGVTRLQAGYGSDESYAVSFTDEFSRTVGNGSFSTRVSYAIANLGGTLGDVNNDGLIDLVGTGATTAQVSLGNGDGSFKVASSYATGNAFASWSQTPTLGDVNGDGRIDILVPDGNDNTVSVLLGNGDGSFKARASYALTTQPTEILFGDFNGDGINDIASGARSIASVGVLLGNADGTFRAPRSWSMQSRAMEAADFNQDGILDLVGAYTQSVEVRFGVGDGTFNSGVTYSLTASPGDMQAADLNRDGAMDLVIADYTGGTTFSVYLGNANGSFKATVSYGSLGTPFKVNTLDYNNDGILDVAIGSNAASGPVAVHLGNGNGTFAAGTSFIGGSASLWGLSNDDVNRDGVTDLIAFDASAGRANILLANTTRVTTIAYLDMSTQSSARSSLATIEATRQRITTQLGILGAFESRLTSGLRTLSIGRDNLLAAESRIIDADIAQESASLARHQILQQVGSSILAQANQQPELALQLLR